MRILVSCVVCSLLLPGCRAERTPESPKQEGDAALESAPAPDDSASAEPDAAPSDAASSGAVPTGKVAACTTDASCNADPAISALWGSCDVETGKCVCKEGAALDPVSQRCRPAQE